MDRTFDRNDVIRMKESLVRLHDDVGRFIDSHDRHPTPDSQLAAEMKEFRRSDVTDSYTLGALLIEVVGDHLMALTKTITEPVQSIAPWTCVRSLLESAAISAWLLDPSVDGKARVQRYLAYRYEGLKQNLAFTRGTKNPETSQIETKIDVLEKHALSMGFGRVTNVKGRRDGIGQRMPSATELIEKMLGQATAYRLMSGFVHGHPWAFAAMAFRVVETHGSDTAWGDPDIVTMVKRADSLHFAWLIVKAATGFAKSVWFNACLLGRGQLELAGILEHAFDELRIARPGERFWRTDFPAT